MSDPRMIELTNNQPTKSAKIRILHRAGYSRRQIADFVGVRYQFVRNVLVDDERRGRTLAEISPGMPVWAPGNDGYDYPARYVGTAPGGHMIEWVDGGEQQVVGQVHPATEEELEKKSWRKTRAGSKSTLKNVAKAPGSPSVGASSMKVRLEAGGRITLPEAVCNALSLREGETLIAVLDRDEIHLLTMPAAVRRAQAIVRQFVPEGVSLVEELLRDRRQEMSRESNDA